jgi:hypothetical protein
MVFRLGASAADVEPRTEEIGEDPQRGERRDSEDSPSEARDLSGADDGQEHEDRVDTHGLPMDPRRQDVALELLYHEEREGGQDRDRRGLEKRQDQRGYCV